MNHETAAELMDRQFVEGELSPHQAEALRYHLQDCRACRARYDKLRRLELALADPTLAAIEPVAEVARRRRSRGARWGVTLAAAAALAGAFVAVGVERDDAFVARSGRSTGKKAWIRVFAKGPSDDRPREVTTALKPTDGLLLAFTNLSDSPWRYMLVVGRDASGSLHWYYPPYAPGGADKLSRAVPAGVADRELAEVIYNDDGYPGGRFVVCAVFSRTPLSARAIHRKLDRGDGWPTDTTQDCHTLQVTP